MQNGNQLYYPYHPNHPTNNPNDPNNPNNPKVFLAWAVLYNLTGLFAAARVALSVRRNEARVKTLLCLATAAALLLRGGGCGALWGFATRSMEVSHWHIPSEQKPGPRYFSISPRCAGLLFSALAPAFKL